MYGFISGLFYDTLSDLLDDCKSLIRFLTDVLITIVSF